MAYVQSLAEIVNTARSLEKKEDKVAYLKENESKPLLDILCLMCDARWTFRFPSDEPPYTPSVMTETHGLLYRETRKFPYFVKQKQQGENLSQGRIEALFIQMLENIDPEDAKLVLRMTSKQPYPDLPPSVINEAFPGSIVDPIEVKRGRGRPKKSEAV